VPVHTYFFVEPLLRTKRCAANEKDIRRKFELAAGCSAKYCRGGGTDDILPTSLRPSRSEAALFFNQLRLFVRMSEVHFLGRRGVSDGLEAK
jgi:hypothetical protein